VDGGKQLEAGARIWTFIALVLPFLAALVAPVLTRSLKHRAAWVLALVPAAVFVHFWSLVGIVSSGTPVTGGFDWIPSLGVRFSFFLDGLSLTFMLLISGIGTFILLYTGGYLRGHPNFGRFLSFILMFMGSMQGLVVADSFLMLFVFWELTSITSFLLIGFSHEREAARRAALQALVVTGAGGLSLLAGLLVIAHVTGANDLSALIHSGSVLRESPLYLAAFVLVLGGAFTKSAQFPLHFWLPNAMEAPTPVSAYLHSATMVKAGVYLLMRLNPVMGGTAAWETVLPIFGGATLLIGTLLGVRQTDLKLMLAYTTVASLGLLVMLTGFGSAVAVEAAVLYLVAHALFKAALFMTAGIIDHEAGHRDITRLRGLIRVMPVTFVAALFAAFSMGGMPPFFGFLAKEEIYHALAGSGGWPVFLMVVAVIGNSLMAAIGFAVAFIPFLRARAEPPADVHEGPASMWLGPLTLAVVGLLAALFPHFTHAVVSSPMASAVTGHPVNIEITAVPELGPAFYLSVLTIGLAVLIFSAFERARNLIAATVDAIGWGPDRGFDQAIRGLVRFAVVCTRIIQSGKLEVYITVTFIAVAATILVPMWHFGELPAWPAFPQLVYYEWVVIALAVIGLGAVVWAKDRLTAIVSLGIQGFAVAVLFMLMGAPDLSFTQFMVETLSVVILALVMTRLRLAPADHRSTAEKALDVPVAAFGGLAFGALLLRVTQVPFNDTLTRFFNENSYVIAHGRNIVNVIIVDFRGLDTLGEISVVTITGLAVLALIRIRVHRPQPEAETVSEGEGAA
jgi:multicomponent Na+:H+ antiporter subunit A